MVREVKACIENGLKVINAICNIYIKINIFAEKYFFLLFICNVYIDVYTL